MDQHYPKSLFSPETVTIVGANDRADSIDLIGLSNMLHNGYNEDASFEFVLDIADTMQYKGMIIMVGEVPNSISNMLKLMERPGLKLRAAMTTATSNASARTCDAPAFSGRRAN